VVQAVNSSVSTYLPNSAISKINRGDPTVVVDAIFKEVFRISGIVHTNSEGYFDPTVGALRNAHGFGGTAPLREMDSRMLDSLGQLVGFDKIEILKDGTVKKTDPAIYIDFNAVAKGYAIDLIGGYFNKKKINNYLIELGGELLASGTNVLKQKPWAVGIETPNSAPGDRQVAETVALYDQGMAASGNYRKFRIDTLTGKKYVHTIDPLTGKAEESNVTSATIVAPTCALADAYATACMAMGFAKAVKMLEQTAAVEGYITYLDSLAQPRVFVTGGFKKLLHH
ncbi:MAG: FAD:protein FMN transferase, partial [Marinirhabdus sp.]